MARKTEILVVALRCVEFLHFCGNFYAEQCAGIFCDYAFTAAFWIEAAAAAEFVIIILFPITQKTFTRIWNALGKR